MTFEVSQDRMEAAMMFLAETDIPAAKAKGRVKALDQYGRSVKAFGFLEATGTVAEREAKSYTTDKWKQHIDNVEQAVIDAETLDNQRASAMGVRDVWRTLQANRRQVLLTRMNSAMIISGIINSNLNRSNTLWT